MQRERQSVIKEDVTVAVSVERAVAEPPRDVSEHIADIRHAEVADTRHLEHGPTEMKGSLDGVFGLGVVVGVWWHTGTDDKEDGMNL